MTQPAKVLAFAGSSRRDSNNKKLAAFAAQCARDAGAEATVIDLGELDLPILNQDLEAAHGLPEGAKRFKHLLLDHDAIVIASPEYNSSLTPLLKNAIDWATRPESEFETPLSAFKGKFAAILSASPGGLGGLRGLVHLRAILQNIGVIVMPSQVSIGSAHLHFDAQGNLTERDRAEQVGNLVRELVKFTARHRGS